VDSQDKVKLRIREIYGFVVFNCGIDPNYFLDEMSVEEVSYLSDAYYKAYKEKWEMLRLQNHAVVATQSTKPIKPVDIMKFEWDHETSSNNETSGDHGVNSNNETSSGIQTSSGNKAKEARLKEARKRIMDKFNVSKNG